MLENIITKIFVKIYGKLIQNIFYKKRRNRTRPISLVIFIVKLMYRFTYFCLTRSMSCTILFIIMYNTHELIQLTFRSHREVCMSIHITLGNEKSVIFEMSMYMSMYVCQKDDGIVSIQMKCT